MFKKLAVLIIFLLPVFAAQAMNFTLGGITAISSINGTCAYGDFLSFSLNSSVAATNDDGSGIDWSVFVVYDAYGTAIATANAAYGVGVSGNLPGFTAIVLDTAQARPFTLNYFDTTAPVSGTAVTGTLLASVTFDPADYGVCAFLPTLSAGTEDEDSAPHFTDGRLNNFDMAAPFVVFGHDFADGRGLVVYSPEGNLLLVVPPHEFAAECTGETVLLASVNGVSLYRLDTCEYQMMATSLDGAKTYILIFNTPYPDTGYSSHEE